MTLSELRALAVALADYVTRPMDPDDFEYFIALQNTLEREIEAREAENVR